MWSRSSTRTPPLRRGCVASEAMDDQLSLLTPPPDPDADRRARQRRAARAEPPLVHAVRSVIADELARVVAERVEGDAPEGGTPPAAAPARYI